jgi:hypothetical protein
MSGQGQSAKEETPEIVVQLSNHEPQNNEDKTAEKYLGKEDQYTFNEEVPCAGKISKKSANTTKKNALFHERAKCDAARCASRVPSLSSPIHIAYARTSCTRFVRLLNLAKLESTNFTVLGLFGMTRKSRRRHVLRRAMRRVSFNLVLSSL